MNHSASSSRIADALARLHLRCLLNRHEPAGRRAEWNGETYLARCEYCDAPIFRLKKGQWRRDRRRSRAHP
jgi:hypothetical protein